MSSRENIKFWIFSIPGDVHLWNLANTFFFISVSVIYCHWCSWMFSVFFSKSFNHRHFDICHLPICHSIICLFLFLMVFSLFNGVFSFVTFWSPISLYYCLAFVSNIFFLLKNVSSFSSFGSHCFFSMDISVLLSVGIFVLYSAINIFS